MDKFKKLCGAYLLLLAVFYGGHLVMSQVYVSPAAAKEVWLLLDWFAAVALLIILMTNWYYLKGAAGDLARISANTAFYASLGTALAFFHNWMGEYLGAHGETIIWVMVDVMVVVLCMVTGRRLMKWA